MVEMTRYSSGTQGFSFAQELPTLQQDAGFAPAESVMLEMKQNSSLEQQLLGRWMSSPILIVSIQLICDREGRNGRDEQLCWPSGHVPRSASPSSSCLGINHSYVG